jgi:hypothetical protein
LPFFHILPSFSLFNFSTVFSKSFHFSTYFSAIFLISFHISTYFSSIIYISFHYSNITRPHIVFTDGRERQPNHNTTTYCVYWRTTKTTQS